MRKKSLVLTTILMLLLFVAGCGSKGSKTPMSPEDFTSKMEDAGYMVLPGMPRIQEEPDKDVTYTARKENGYCFITLDVFSEEQDAQEWYELVLNQFQSTYLHEEIDVEIKEESTDRVIAVMPSEMREGKTYYVRLARVANTVLQVSVTEEYIQETEDILSGTGY